MRRVLLVIVALLASPLASAQQKNACANTLGRGWPVAGQNWGAAVEQLFSVGLTESPALSLTRLPEKDIESGLMLIPSAAGIASGDDWTLRYVEADKRVHYWKGNDLVLRVEQEPEIQDVPIPADVATELLDVWYRALSVASPVGAPAMFDDTEAWTFAIGSLRASGPPPRCGAFAKMREQVELLIEASDEGEEKRKRRWEQLQALTDELSAMLAADFPTVDKDLDWGDNWTNPDAPKDSPPTESDTPSRP